MRMGDAGIRGTVYPIVILTLFAPLSRAGLYGPHEVSPFTANAAGVVEALSFNSDGSGRFPLEYARVGNIGDPRRVTRERTEVLERIKTFDSTFFGRGEGRPGPLHYAWLAADLTRTRQYDLAIQKLQPFMRDRIPQFIVLANLAHTYAMKGEWADALRVHEAALLDAEFPADIANAKWLQRVEKDYYNRWLKLHNEETRKKVSPSQEKVFPLFEGPPPEDAIAIVQQLLLWAPDDNRLVWLLAELYANANQPRVAERLFDSLASQDRMQSNRVLLMEHRAAVKRIVAALPPEVEPTLTTIDPPDTRSVWEKLGVSDLQFRWAVGIFSAIAAILLRFQFRRLRRRFGRTP